MRVRVENLYYLLCYAWQCLDARDIVPVSDIAGRSPEALFARVLDISVRRLLKQGLERGYVERTESTRRPRGKIDLARTIGAGKLNHGVVECAFDELTVDILPNQAIKAALRKLILADAVGADERSQLRALVAAMDQVSDVANIGSRHFAGISLRGGLRRYRLVLSICELLSRRALLDESTGRLRFSSFVGSDQEMGLLFEDFLRQFFRLEQRRFNDVGARGRRSSWRPSATERHCPRPGPRVSSCTRTTCTSSWRTSRITPRAPTSAFPARCFTPPTTMNRPHRSGYWAIQFTWPA
jgi:5-methylcytosine-specific restriction enzyme subunit McrC